MVEVALENNVCRGRRTAESDEREVARQGTNELDRREEEEDEKGMQKKEDGIYRGQRDK